ncbi:MAG: hypothetical protein K8T26_12860 [Lentisphaerae bacterium]|nr:hypothetical protein [Lentisphaerota bacterium]
MNRNQLLTYLEAVDRALQRTRYDEIDQSDIRYLLAQTRITFRDVELAAATLPSPFDTDPLVIENLRNLKTDMELGGHAS